MALEQSGQQRKRAIQVLLLKDVEDLGRSGDVVRARPGYVRNFLVPKKLGLVADARALQLQAQLQADRAKLAQLEKAESEALAKRIEGTRLRVDVKIDPSGNMYGSVTGQDILRMLEEKGIVIERRAVALSQPLKKMGQIPITLRLKEGVTATIFVEIIPEGGTLAPAQSAEEEQE